MCGCLTYCCTSHVAPVQASDKAATALADFNARLLGDERIDLCIVPVGDGMALCRKR